MFFYMAYPGRHPRPAQARPRATQERIKRSQERPKSSQELPNSDQERPKSGQETPKGEPELRRWAQERPRRAQDSPGPPKGRPKTPQNPAGPHQMRPKRLQDRSKSVKFAPRASKSSRDVERKVENKHVNLKSEAHAQNRQRGAARDERSEDLESEVRPTTPTKNRLHPKGNPKSSRTTPKDSRAAHTMNSCQAHPAHGTSLRGGGGARPQGVLDKFPYEYA